MEDGIFSLTQPRFPSSTCKSTRPSSCSSTLDRLSMERSVTDSLKMMATCRKNQLLELRNARNSEVEVKELSSYAQDRFLHSAKLRRGHSSSALASRSLLSPSATMSSCLTDELGDKKVTLDTYKDDILDGRHRSRLMNSIRTKQHLQTIRYSHDRIAQEIVQEGELLSNAICFPFRWNDKFRYKPQPEPRIHDWLSEAKEIQKERQKKADIAELITTDTSESSADLEHQILLDLAENNAEVDIFPIEVKTTELTVDKSRPSNRRASVRKGSVRRKSDIHKKGPFSVSSIGDAEKQKLNEEIKRIKDLISRLKQNRQEALLKKQQEQQKLERKLVEDLVENIPEPVPQPEVTPAAKTLSPRSPRKGSAKKGSTKGARKKRNSSAKSSTSSGSRRSVKTSPKKLNSKPVVEASKTVPEAVPDNTEDNPQRIKDDIDIAIEKLEALDRMSQIVKDGDFPGFPCPSSEAKSREFLTKQWCLHNPLSARVPPSLIT